jgi:ATP-dependent RNA helicase DeaD
MPEIYRKLEWLSKEDLIKRVVSHEFNRFEEYYRGRAEIESPTDSRSEKRGEKGGRKRTAEAGYTRMFINLGKTDKFMPNDLITLLNNNTRGRVDLGRINLMKNYSFFEVDEKETKNVLKALGRAKWNGRKVVVEVASDEPSDSKDGGKKLKHDKHSRHSDDQFKEKHSDEKHGEKRKEKHKPSREERGYTKPRGKKDDWKKFFEQPEPDFSEEGWARRSPKKK